MLEARSKWVAISPSSGLTQVVRFWCRSLLRPACASKKLWTCLWVCPRRSTCAVDWQMCAKGVKSDLTLDVHPSSGMRKQKALDLFVGLPTKVNLCRRLADVRKGLTSDLTLNVHPSSETRAKQKALDPAPLGVYSKACCHFVLFPFIKTYFRRSGCILKRMCSDLRRVPAQ